MGFINSIHDTKTGCDSVITGAMDIIICYDSADTVNKVAIGPLGFSLDENKIYKIKFINGNTADNPTLNINGTGAKSIDSDGFNIADGIIYNLSYENNKYRVYISNYIGYCDSGAYKKLYFNCNVYFNDSIFVKTYIHAGWCDNGSVCWNIIGNTWLLSPHLNVENCSFYDALCYVYYNTLTCCNGTYEFPLQVYSLCSRDSAINKVCLVKLDSNDILKIYLKNSSDIVYALCRNSEEVLNVSKMVICGFDICNYLI